MSDENQVNKSTSVLTKVLAGVIILAACTGIWATLNPYEAPVANTGTHQSSGW